MLMCSRFRGETGRRNNNISGAENDFDRPSGTAVFLYRYPGTSYLATILLSLRDKMHAPAKASLS